MADRRVRRDGIAALCALHQRARYHRKGTDDRGLMLQAGFRAQSGDGGPEAIDDRQAARNSEQLGKPGEGAFARRAQGGADGGLTDGLAGSTAPQSRGYALEAGFAHEVADALAG